MTTPALAQSNQGYRAARQDNRAASREIDDRMGRTIGAVTDAESRGTISHQRADALRNLIDRMRADYSRNRQSQGFVSAGELASYNRSLDQVDSEIRPDNRTTSADVDDRMGRTIAAVTTAESRGVVSRRRADVLRNMIVRMRADYARNKHQQGFVSAGELASYNRSLDQVDREIHNR